jgi:hypothetical protein
MALIIRSYSRRHIVAASVVFLMLFGLLVWNQQETITRQISSTTPSSSSHKDSSDDTHHHSSFVIDEKPAPTKTTENDDNDAPAVPPATSSDSSDTTDDTGNGKTKPRFWTSKGHLLPSVWDYKRPENIHKIMGLVFYGRRQPISILDCYLKVCPVIPSMRPPLLSITNHVFITLP